ncbi:MAG TPA: hypothetical protein IAC64_00640 [Candidatus Caccomorpha excrementavium]|nr:hypothetical protein [Candidatus Caccomorpha excrementavium]
MDEKASGYLSVKDIARIKSKHEETIRRWINTSKIEVPKFNSKKEGYSIPVESLIQSGILTREEVNRYLYPDSHDPRASGKDFDSLGDWRSLMKEKEAVKGEELLQLITELNRISAEYNKKKKQLEEQILQLKNQIVDLEFRVSSLDGENRQIQDHITFLRSRL